MISETNWTKGPWETDIREHDEPYQKIRIRSAEYQYRVIAEVWQDDAPLVDYNREQRANARLMIAAPDMAEVLDMLVDVPELQGGAWEKMAREVLAKARGETS